MDIFKSCNILMLQETWLYDFEHCNFVSKIPNCNYQAAYGMDEVDMSLVDSILPTTCQSISLSCNGVITPTEEVENLSDDPMLPATTAIVFPAFNHVRITPVEIKTAPQHHDCSGDDDLSDPDWDVDNDYGGGDDTSRTRNGAGKSRLGH